MGAVVTGLLLGVVWLVVRAVRSRGGTRERLGAWGLVVVAVLLVGWFAVHQLVVTSGRLADTVDRVYVVSTPDRVLGPVGLLAATELELDTELLLTLEDRRRTAREELTRYEMTDHLLGVPIGTACVEERLVSLDDGDSRSYVISPGRCE